MTPDKKERLAKIEALLEEIMETFGGNGVGTLIVRDMDDPERGVMLSNDDFASIYEFMRQKGFQQ